MCSSSKFQVTPYSPRRNSLGHTSKEKHSNFRLTQCSFGLKMSFHSKFIQSSFKVHSKFIPAIACHRDLGCLVVISKSAKTPICYLQVAGSPERQGTAASLTRICPPLLRQLLHILGAAWPCCGGMLRGEGRGKKFQHYYTMMIYYVHES